MFQPQPSANSVYNCYDSGCTRWNQSRIHCYQIGWTHTGSACRDYLLFLSGRRLLSWSERRACTAGGLKTIAGGCIQGPDGIRILTGDVKGLSHGIEVVVKWVKAGGDLLYLAAPRLTEGIASGAINYGDAARRLIEHIDGLGCRIEDQITARSASYLHARCRGSATRGISRVTS